jgi:hypothetical protein
VTLPEAELSFYFAAPAQLEPARRPVFTERVTRLLGAHPNPGPGDVDRAVRRPGGLVDAAGNRGIPDAPALGSRYAGVRAGFEARLVSCGALVDSVWTHGGWYMS